MSRPQRGVWQRKALIAALQSPDGYISCGASHGWSVAPAVYACVSKGWLEMSRGRTRAKPTPAGLELAEKHRDEEVLRA
jgi:hypothetical protein